MDFKTIDYEAIEKIIVNIKKIVEVGVNTVSDDLIESLDEGIRKINEIIFFNEKVVGFFLDKLDCHTYLDDVSKWTELIENIISEQKKLSGTDYKFRRLMDFIKYVPHEDKRKYMIDAFMNCAESRRINIAGMANQFHNLYGYLDIENNNYELIEMRIDGLEKHYDDYLFLYEKLADERSKGTLFEILMCWIDFNVDHIVKMKDHLYDDYFDKDIIRCDENEVVVECGGYVGDTVLSYVDNYKYYRKIYVYEVVPRLCEIIKENCIHLNNLEIKNLAVGDENGVMYIDNPDSEGSITQIKKEGKAAINVVKVDDDINEKISFLIMDIEGAEQGALRGCRKHIKEDKPKMAICVYHNYDDLAEIPRMMLEMNPEYRLYLRANGRTWLPSEFVIFAV